MLVHSPVPALFARDRDEMYGHFARTIGKRSDIASGGRGEALLGIYPTILIWLIPLNCLVYTKPCVVGS